MAKVFILQSNRNIVDIFLRTYIPVGDLGGKVEDGCVGWVDDGGEDEVLLVGAVLEKLEKDGVVKRGEEVEVRFGWLDEKCGGLFTVGR